MLYLFGLSIAFFLLLLIVLKKNKTRADHILLAWISLIFLHLFLFYAHHRELSYRYPHTLGVSLALPILHGVFLYFYTRELTGRSILNLRSVFLHLTPFLLLVALAMPFYLLSAEEKITVFRNEGKGYEWYGVVQMIAFLISGFTYSVVSFLHLRRHQHEILQTFSNTDKKRLEWLDHLAIGLAMIWFLSAFFHDDVVFAGVVIFVLFIGFFGIHQYPVFYASASPNIKGDETANSVGADAVAGQAERVTPSSTEEKYAKSGLHEDDVYHVMYQLEKVMRTQEPYRNPNLTLNDLAGILKLSPNHLSQAINMRTGKTFYHYINSYRIEEFIRVSSLPGNRKYTYLGLAYQCGFSSKTTFNKYFKIETGTTPSSYFDFEAEEASAPTFAEK